VVTIVNHERHASIHVSMASLLASLQLSRPGLSTGYDASGCHRCAYRTFEVGTRATTTSPSFDSSMTVLLSSSRQTSLLSCNIFKHHMHFCFGNSNNSAGSRRITHGCVRSPDHLSLSKHVPRLTTPSLTTHQDSSITLRMRETWTSPCSGHLINRTQPHCT
jgi:hypothetical protein